MNWIRLFSVVIGLLGLAILFYADWRIALGVYLCLWGNNIDNQDDQRQLLEALMTGLTGKSK